MRRAASPIAMQPTMLTQSVAHGQVAGSVVSNVPTNQRAVRRLLDHALLPARAPRIPWRRVRVVPVKRQVLQAHRGSRLERERC